MAENTDVIGKRLPFRADIVGKDGVKRTKDFSVRVLSVNLDKLKGKISTDSLKRNQASNEASLPEESKSGIVTNDIIDPPYNPLELIKLEEVSNVLRECIDSMVVNIGGFGYYFRPRKMPKEFLAKNKDIIEMEEMMLNTMFRYISQDISFTDTRKKWRKDLELTGNAYLEVIRDKDWKISELNHIPTHRIRLLKSDKKFTKYPLKIIRPDKDYIQEELERRKRFRRFVQLDMSDKPTVYFKEYGDPRNISKKTGDVIRGGVNSSTSANELIHFKIYTPRSVYGIPRHIGRYISILGSRKSEEVNFFTLDNNVPSMFVMVENGALTEGSINRLNELVESQVSGQPNFSKFVILEAEADMNEILPGQVGAAKVTIKSMTETQRTDQMFQDYDMNNQNKVRQAFRLPPIFLGRCHSDDTEYLTEYGWMRFNDIPNSIKLATVNQDSWYVEYQEPIERFSYDYDGELLWIKNRGLDALITPNHNLWTRPATNNKRTPRDWELLEAEELFDVYTKGNGGHYELPVSADWDGKFLNEFTIPSSQKSGSGSENTWTPDKPSKHRDRDLERWKKRLPRNVDGTEFLKFLGYFVTEGSTTHRTVGSISLSQNEGPIADEMIQIIKRLGFKPRVTKSKVSKTGNQQLNIRFSHMGLWNWLRENCGTYSYNKKFPEFILNISSGQLLILMRTLTDGDGTWKTERGTPGAFSYSTISKILNDQIHEICLKLGIAYTSRFDPRDGHPTWKPIWRGYGHFSKKHLVHPIKQIESVPYKGKVSCFKVPNGLLVTRRGGRVLISGNSDDYTRATAESSRKLADEQVFGPERSAEDMIMTRLLEEMGVRFHEFKSRTPNVTDNESLIQGMRYAELSGGMTPARADKLMEDLFEGELGPMPEGIDPNVPYSFQFAQAQNGMLGPGNTSKPIEDNDDDDEDEDGETKRSSWVRGFIKDMNTRDRNVK